MNNRIRHVSRGSRGGDLPCTFLKIGKKYPHLGKECPDCGHLWVKFLFYSAIFRRFQEKKLEIFLRGIFLSHIADNCLWKCSNSKKKIPSPKNFLVTRPCMKKYICQKIKLKYTCSKCLFLQPRRLSAFRSVILICPRISDYDR